MRKYDSALALLFSVIAILVACLTVRFVIDSVYTYCVLAQSQSYVAQYVSNFME